jgi:hypothetical protein
VRENMGSRFGYHPPQILLGPGRKNGKRFCDELEVIPGHARGLLFRYFCLWPLHCPQTFFMSLRSSIVFQRVHQEAAARIFGILATVTCDWPVNRPIADQTVAADRLPDSIESASAIRNLLDSKPPHCLLTPQLSATHGIRSEVEKQAHRECYVERRASTGSADEARIAGNADARSASRIISSTAPE